MRVLQVSVEGLGNGGVQSVIMNICRNLSDIHFDILLFTNEKRHYDDEFEQLGGCIFRIPNYEGKSKFRRRLDYYIRFLRVFSGTYKILKRNEKYDVIHCHNELESGICNLAAYFAGVKVRIAHAHTSSDKFSKKNITVLYRKTLQKLMNKSSNVKLGCTKKAFNSLFEKKHLNNSNSYIVPNSIDLNLFFKSAASKKNKNIFNIVHVGRYSDNKNQIFIVDLLPHILKFFKNIKLKLVGWGEEYKNLLAKRVKELNLQKHVELLPFNSNIKEILENADVFIFPSKSEGFGIVLLEAQAMEVPCLVSDTVPQIVNCGLCKFISLDEDKEVWSKHVINILNCSERMQLNTEKLKIFDVNNYVLFIKSLYEGEEYESWDAYFPQNI